MHHCSEPFTYVLLPGDNLFQLSRVYKTTVQSILKENPELDPYNLRAGNSVCITPGGQSAPTEVCDACPDSALQFQLLSDMRYRWAQHVYWTRLFLISAAERLRDQKDTENRLLKNPKDIAGIFSAYYNAETARTVERLLTEHLQIGGAFVTALRDKRAAEAEKLKAEWYRNAERTTKAFSEINPYYVHDELLRMLNTHLDLTTKEIVARLIADYAADVAAFDVIEEEALSMADYLSVGIMQQFPQKFQ